MKDPLPSGVAGWDLAARLRLILLVGSLMILVVWVLLPPSTPHRLSRPEVRAALVEVVEAQTRALREEDYKLAWSHAAKGAFGGLSEAEFRGMVVEAHPDLPSSTRISCGLAYDNGSEAFLSVLVWSGERRPREYLYFFNKERSGWKVAQFVPGHSGLVVI